jgi:hypothetical protein
VCDIEKRNNFFIKMRYFWLCSNLSNFWKIQ